LSGVLVPIEDANDVISARQHGRVLAEELGFTGTDVTLIATAISEVARNIVEHAHRGEVELAIVTEDDCPTLVVIARDEGPGIADVDVALRDGYSTTGAMGLGLPGARRLMDEFAIVSTPGKGTVVTMKRRAGSAPEPVRLFDGT
jgi:serine/threonine-protein kinase RsbT